MQGWRRTQEDAHIMHEVSLKGGIKGMLFGVFDGHGGAEVSKFTKTNFKSILIETKEFLAGDYKKALEVAFLLIDKKLIHANIIVSGCTACVVLITPDTIFCSNAGDSRAILNNKSIAVALSEDHKPMDKIELDRITKAGHSVFMNRVDGTLALSRAFGDLEFKNADLLPA